MQKLRFTDRTIDNLGPGTYGDTLLPAFCLRVGTTARTFYTIRNGRRHKVGRYPSVSLSDARNRARRILAQDGPIIAPEPFSDVWQAYKGEHLSNYRPRARYNVERLISRYCDPITAKNLPDITTRDISALWSAIPHSQANHLFGVLRTFFLWAERNEYLDRSPLSKLQRPHKEASRDRVLTDDEIKALWNGANPTDTFGAIVRLCTLTALRSGEASAIQPPWIISDGLLIPAAKTKNGHEHLLPLSDQAKALCQFISEHPLSHNSLNKPKAALSEKLKLDYWCVHDLRRTHATIQARIGTPPHIIEAILNHKSGEISGVARVYNKYRYAREMRDALLKYETHITTIIAS